MAMLLLCSAWAVAQVVYTEPVVVQQSSTGIVVYFNAAEGNKGLMGYTGEVYAHTGVITSESTGNSGPSTNLKMPEPTCGGSTSAT